VSALPIASSTHQRIANAEVPFPMETKFAEIGAYSGRWWQVASPFRDCQLPIQSGVASTRALERSEKSISRITVDNNRLIRSLAEN